jgi:hypothetical protein
MGIRITRAGAGGESPAAEIRQLAGGEGCGRGGPLMVRRWSAGRFSQAGVVEFDPRGLGCGGERRRALRSLCAHREPSKPTKCSPSPAVCRLAAVNGARTDKVLAVARGLSVSGRKQRPDGQSDRDPHGLSVSARKPRRFDQSAFAWGGLSDSSPLSRCPTSAAPPARPRPTLADPGPEAQPREPGRNARDARPDARDAGPGRRRRFRLDARSAKGVIWLYVCTRAVRVLCEPPFEERVIWPSASCHSLRMWRS